MPTTVPVVLPPAVACRPRGRGTRAPPPARRSPRCVRARTSALRRPGACRAPRAPCACTPRNGTLASVPVERLGRLITTKSSAEATGPWASRGDARGLLDDVGVLAPETRHLVGPLPERMIIATSSRPPEPWWRGSPRRSTARRRRPPPRRRRRRRWRSEAPRRSPQGAQVECRDDGDLGEGVAHAQALRNASTIRSRRA